MTAEEKGLLGAKYYATNPLYPLNKTLANINIDGVNQWGRTKDITMVGDDNSTLIDLLRDVAKSKAASSSPILNPKRASTIVPIISSSRSRACRRSTPIPARITSARMQAFSKQKRDEYTAKDYHKVSDDIKSDWDLAGAVDDAQLLLIIGYRVAQGDTFPTWKSGSEFKAKRDATMGG